MLALIAGGTILAPEAAAITRHYCLGNGQTLYLESKYIKNSPVVTTNMNLRIGQTRKVVLKQQEDWRLSYALNPFHMKRTPSGYIIYEYVDYGHGANKNVLTKLKIGPLTVRVHDNIVHSFKCTPFTVIFNLGDVNKKLRRGNLN